MSKVILKTAKRENSISRIVVRNAVSGAYITKTSAKSLHNKKKAVRKASQNSK